MPSPCSGGDVTSPLLCVVEGSRSARPPAWTIRRGPPASSPVRGTVRLHYPSLMSPEDARPADAIRTARPGPGERVREGFREQRMAVLPGSVVAHARDLPVVRELYVTDIGHYPFAQGHYVDRPRYRGGSILIYCMAGRGWCELEGREWRVGDGAAIVIPPGVSHTYGADPSHPWTIWWVHFGGALAIQFLEALGISPRQPTLYAPATLRIGDAFEGTYDHLEHGYSDTALLGLSTGLARVLGLLKTHQRAPHARGRTEEDRIRRSIRYMREHLDQPLRLAELADLLGVSVPHYSTLFRKVVGTSPGRFLTHLKMQRACELLDATELRVEEVGRRVGFKDPFHFSRAFKRVVGKPPLHYRATVKG